MKSLVISLAIFAAVLAGGFFLFLQSSNYVIRPSSGKELNLEAKIGKNILINGSSSTDSGAKDLYHNNSGDIQKQSKLENPPSIVKSLYLTGWSAGSSVKLDMLIKKIKDSNLNAMVIDIKDYSGHISYYTDVEEARLSGAEDQIRILYPNKLIKKLHDNHIYVIGRITVFQDPILAKFRPKLAVSVVSSTKLWADNKGLYWMDPSSIDVWKYNVDIAKDALSRGFDEVNFDYVRFPSDGNMRKAYYPVLGKAETGSFEKHKIIKNFFSYIKSNLPNSRISVDLFGLTTVNEDDLGIGQMIEDAYPYFDYVCPMVYPSHYSPGFLGYKNPADYPYEVVKYSMENAFRRLIYENTYFGNSVSSSLPSASSASPYGATLSNSTAGSNSVSGERSFSGRGKGDNKSWRYKAKIRPWIQSFNLGAIYNSTMVEKEIQAVKDATPARYKDKVFGGWMLWDPSNTYKAINGLVFN